MPKGPEDETKLRAEDGGPSALRSRSYAAAKDGLDVASLDIPEAPKLAPAPMLKRGRGGLFVLLPLAAIAAIAGAAWFFLLR